MSIEAKRKLFTVDDYYRMADVGIFSPEDRVELVGGEIVKVSPVGARHAGSVTATAELFVRAFAEAAIVRVQNPLRLDDFTELEPDIVVVERHEDFYRTRHPVPGDTFLVVEVSDTTLAYDRDVKLPRYASAGIPEVWIADLTSRALLVYSDPTPHGYRTMLTFRSGDTVSPERFKDATFDVSQLLG